MTLSFVMSDQHILTNRGVRPKKVGNCGADYWSRAALRL